MAQEAGFIEGELSYPSDGIPSDMKVCADNLDTGIQTCTSKHLRRGRRTHYRLAVPAGRYHVWSSTREAPGRRAYYNDFVVCGTKASCPSHRKIEVAVRAGQTIRKIDPGDWYDS